MSTAEPTRPELINTTHRRAPGNETSALRCSECGEMHCEHQSGPGAPAVPHPVVQEVSYSVPDQPRPGGHECPNYPQSAVDEMEREAYERGISEGCRQTTGRRAVDADGVPWWIHECGLVTEAATRPGPHACESCEHAPGQWRALHVAAGSPSAEGDARS